MLENQAETDSEKLRAFEKKMHDEGAAGFADGPSPWETWDDESGLKANNRVWEGKSKRIYPKNKPQQSLGDRVLSGLAMLSLATMVVGIAGVYFSSQQPRQEVATGIQPLPIDRTPAAADSTIASLKQLPAPAAGTMAAVDTAPDTDQDVLAPPVPATLTTPEPLVVAVPAPPDDTAVQTPDLPGIPAVSPATSGEDSTDDLATGPAPAEELPQATAETDNTPGITGTTAAAVSEDSPNTTVSTPVRAARDADTLETTALPATVTTAPVTVTVTVTTGPAENITTEARAVTPADTTAAQDSEAAMAAAKPETATAPPASAALPEAVPDTAAAQDSEAAMAAVKPETATAPPASAALPEAVPDTAAAGLAGPGDGADEAPAVSTDSPPLAVAGTTTANAGAAAATPVTDSGVTDTIAGLESLPVPMAGPGDIADERPAASSAAQPPAASDASPEAADTVVAIARQGDGVPATPPAEAAELIVPATETGSWVVNLASYTRKSMANRMLAEFRDKGADAELVTVMINDKPMHRIRVAGFANSRAAKASIGPLEQQLGLEGVWISRK